MDRVETMDYQIGEGAQVRSADDEKLGKVVAVQQEYLVVEKGFLFPTDYYVPTSAIANYDGDTVYLNVGKDDALNSGWNLVPDDTVGTTVTNTYTTTDDGRYGVGTVTDAGTERFGEQPFEHGSYADSSHIHEDDRLVVPIHEEELTATKRAVDRGQVRVDKEVVAEERTLEVPVTEERVHVERRVVDRPVAEGDSVFEEGTIEVPVRGEEVDLQKRVRVAEEVEIGKEAVARTERVAGTVRREEVRVDDATTQTDAGLVGRTGDAVDSTTE
jgi:uncharacterized protein (TIGR02271 family)